MIVWGGYNGSSYLNDGGRYNPTANSWTALDDHRRTRRALLSHGGVDRQRDDRLGRTDGRTLFQHGGRYNPDRQHLDGRHHHRRARRALLITRRCGRAAR